MSAYPEKNLERFALEDEKEKVRARNFKGSKMRFLNKKSIIVLLVLLLMLGFTAAASAEGEGEEPAPPTTEPAPTPAPTAQPAAPKPTAPPPNFAAIVYEGSWDESGNAADYFFNKNYEQMVGEESWKWKVNPKNIATAFKNTVTGETRFLNPDEYIYAASVYKLPLNMYYADRIAAGEMSMDTPIGGVRYELLMNSSIVSSNNSTAQKLRDAVTWDFGEYQDIVLEYLFPDEKDRVKVDPIFYRSHYYNQRMVINFLSILYENSGKYGYIIDKMKISMPRDSLFKGIDTGYEVAHKYGLFTIDGYQALNDVGIVYMPEPILISMFTKNTSAAPIAKYLVLMVDWSKYCSGMRQVQENAMAAATIDADLLA